MSQASQAAGSLINQLACRSRLLACLAPMKMASHSVIVLVTAPGLEIARRLARAALEPRLAACVNLVPRIESHYWWQGRLESSAEVLLVLKTTRPRLRELEKVILANHPYDTPEFVVLPLTGGNERYLAWLASNVARRTTS